MSGSKLALVLGISALFLVPGSVEAQGDCFECVDDDAKGWSCNKTQSGAMACDAQPGDWCFVYGSGCGPQALYAPADSEGIPFQYSVASSTMDLTTRRDAQALGRSEILNCQGYVLQVAFAPRQAESARESTARMQVALMN